MAKYLYLKPINTTDKVGDEMATFTPGEIVDSKDYPHCGDYFESRPFFIPQAAPKPKRPAKKKPAKG